MEANGGNSRWEELASRAQYKPSEIAKLTKVSLRTLQRHFKSNYNVTISTWLRSLRLNEAYSRLAAGNSVKEVAYGLGFKQLSHFSREFKKMYGVAPSCLRGGEKQKTPVVLSIAKVQDRFVVMAASQIGNPENSE
jgi:AraC-like DNA-binding protein